MSGGEKAPRLDASVLLATRNRARLLRATLDHLARLEPAGASFEVIVVDNGSTDETPAVLEEARARLPLVTLCEPRPGKNCALNRALPVARGELLLFTDDDVEPVPCWLAEHLAASRRWPEHSIFGGPVMPKYPPDTPAWLREHPFATAAFARFLPPGGEGPCDLPFGANYAVRARRMAGLRFCEEMGTRGKESDLLGGETELLIRLRAEGEGVIFVPSAGVGHVVERHQTTLPWLFRRSFRLGRTIGRLWPDVGAKRLLGTPRYLWPRLSAAGLRHARAFFRDERARFKAGIELYQVRGLLYEYLVQRASTRWVARLFLP